MKVKIKKLHPDAVIPSYAKPGDAGMDIVSIRKEKDKHNNDVHYTGIALEIPEGHVGLIYPRSSISPTISSKISSIVIMPTDLSFSSTTMPIGCLL